jgi:hypothetical protein
MDLESCAVQVVSGAKSRDFLLRFNLPTLALLLVKLVEYSVDLQSAILQIILFKRLKGTVVLSWRGHRRGSREERQSRHK